MTILEHTWNVAILALVIITSIGLAFAPIPHLGLLGIVVLALSFIDAQINQ